MFGAPQHIAVADPLGWITCLSFWKPGTWKNKRAVRLFPLSFLRTKSCELVQILQTPLNCFWHYVDLYLKVRLFFSLGLSTTYKTLIEFVTCKKQWRATQRCSTQYTMWLLNSKRNLGGTRNVEKWIKTTNKRCAAWADLNFLNFLNEMEKHILFKSALLHLQVRLP